MIVVERLTKLYPSGKGVRALDFTIPEGEVFGYLGPNGAGKTTTIRNLLGFLRPDSGSCSIGGLDCWTQASEVQRRLGYIPGEIAFISCTFNESRTAIGASAAVLVGFFIVSVIARIGHGQGVYEIIDRFSIYYLLKARPIVSGEVNLWLNNGLLMLIAAAGIGGGIHVFSRKDLPL